MANNEGAKNLASLICIAGLVHTFLFAPYVMKSLYNWYLQAFCGTEAMTWNIALGLMLLFNFMNRGTTKVSMENEEPIAKITWALIYAMAIWITYGVGRLFVGVNWF